MENKLVLIACEESQRVCKAFRDRGFTAFSADIQEPSGGHPEWHILGDVTPLLKGCCDFKTMSGDIYSVSSWDLVIAHPPCTYLSNANVHCNKTTTDINDERYRLGLDGAAFWWKCYNANASHICVENPIPQKRFNLPKYTQIISPHMFGSIYSKRTCLWLKNLPELKPTNVYQYPISCIESTWFNAGGDRHKNRSKTFPQIAKAMADQWGDIL